MMRSRPFHQLDVFSAQPLRGNPLAVVHDADGLSDAQMQAFAHWTNLSETTFLLPARSAEADYRVRIFTPGGELDFAGHPTLGSCKAWLVQGGVPKRAGRVLQECNVGLVSLRQEGDRLAFSAPASTRSDVSPRVQADIARALGIEGHEIEIAATLDNGTAWVVLLLRDADTVLKLEPDHTALRSLPKVGVVGPYAQGGECQLELRAFAACKGIPEDPVTGSLNASVAQWLMELKRVPERYRAAQGARLGRAGRVYLERTGEELWVGGDVTVCVLGELRI